MFSSNPQTASPEVVLEKHISVKAAADFAGYSIQYLRRLLRQGRLEGVKIGQVWLINLASLDTYLKRARLMSDRRCGPRLSHEGQTDCVGKVLFAGVNVARTQLQTLL
jgi:excisionase family DNA binding protein